MLLANGSRYQLEELVVCGPVEEEVLADIETHLRSYAEGGGSPESMLQLDKNDAVINHDGLAPLESLMVIAEAIRRFQRERDGLLGRLLIRQAIVPFHLEPKWHDEVMTDAFVVTTVAATQGLTGTVPAKNFLEARNFVLTHAEKDPEFTTLPGVSIVQPPTNSLIRITRGAFHRSPHPTPNTPADKLIINANIWATFLGF